MSLKNCKTIDDYKKLLEDSFEEKVFLLKHSTRCEVSEAALNATKQFLTSHAEANFWKVLVIEDRPTSLHIAEDTGITHKSPQVIVFENGKPVWNDSHFKITSKALEEASHASAS